VTGPNVLKNVLANVLANVVTIVLAKVLKLGNTFSVEMNSSSVAFDCGIYFKFGHKVLICGGGVIPVMVDADTAGVNDVFHPYRFSGLKMSTEFVDTA